MLYSNTVHGTDIGRNTTIAKLEYVMKKKHVYLKKRISLLKASFFLDKNNRNSVKISF